MRVWPPWRRGAPLSSAAVYQPGVETLVRDSVDDVLEVRGSHMQGAVVVLRGRLTLAARRALDVLIPRLRPFGYTPFLRADGDGDVVLQAWPLAQAAESRRVRVNVVLFVLTCLSTVAAGALLTGGLDIGSLGRWLWNGLPFAVTLLAILGVHEFGHYFTARYYGASVSLPYFIPAPPPIFLFGTLGAIIRMRSPARDRNSLFDIAAAGPLAGLAIAVPAVLLGLGASRVAAVPPGEHLRFGDPLLMRWLVYLKFGTIPQGMDVFIDPVALAGWVGLFVTALNLIPVGQLDGGRIAYALFGRGHRLVGMLTFAALIGLGAVTGSANWFAWAVLIFVLVGFHHQPPLDDITPLSPGRRVLGLVCLILLVVLIPPVPIEIG
jgi:membrane-associated protease RseP (regulator of RpoE activity)